MRFNLAFTDIGSDWCFVGEFDCPPEGLDAFGEMVRRLNEALGEVAVTYAPTGPDQED